MRPYDRRELNGIYGIAMDELKVAREDYSEAVRATRLTEVANTLRNMLDA